ncbi:ABC transporter permease [Candidatus Poribacteria bacterium]|nr:ABC transporter permease [Candidatus Poribacteria bacterium]
MRNILTLTQRELRSYFQSPIAYAVITVFLVVTGVIFWLRFSFFYQYSLEVSRNPYMMQQYEINVTEQVLEPIFYTISFLSLFVIPMLTMRSFSEDKKSGAIELLLTYPVRDIEVALSKLLACFIVYACMIALTLLYPALTAKLSNPETASVVMGYVGLLLSGAAFVSVGMFISSMTENQIIAVATSYGLLLLFWLLGATEDSVPPPYNTVLTDLSLFNHMENFARGVLNTRDLVYYLNFVILFMFLTLRSLEVTKWKGKA